MAKKDRSRERDALLDRMKKGKEKETGGAYENQSIFKSDLGDDVTFWRATEKKKHWIDIIPYKAGKYDPDAEEGTETYVFQPYMHYHVGPAERDVICVKKTYGKKCAICDYVAKMVADGEEDEAVDAVKVQRNPRAIYNVVVLDSEEEKKKGVQIFHTSHFTMEMHLLEAAEAPTRPGKEEIDPFVNFAHKEKGKTVYFKRKSMFEFIGHKFEDRDYEISKKHLKQAYTLDEMVFIPTYEEAKAIIMGEDEEGEEREERRDSKDTEDDNGNGLREKLEGMSERRLMKYIRDEELDIDPDEMDADEMVEAILEEVEGKGTGADDDDDIPSKDDDDDENECPGGGVFGKDLDELPYCEKKCPKKKWEECATEYDRLQEE